jgi:hypothetical protein
MSVDQPLVAVHENVVGFDVELVRELLGHLYEIVVVKMNPAQLGFWFIWRPRVYTLLFLRSGVQIRVSPQQVLDSLCAYMARESGDIAHAWNASEADLLVEENRARAQAALQPLERPSGLGVEKFRPRVRGSPLGAKLDSRRSGVLSP